MNANHLNSPTQDCDAVRDLVADYAFGLTDVEETRLVESNLDDCLEAAAQLAEFRQLQDTMRADVTQVEPSAQLGERLMAAVAPPALVVAPRPRRARIPLAWLAAAAAVIALVASNVFWLTRVDALTQGQSDYAANDADGGTQHEAFVLTSTSALRWVRLPPTEQDVKVSAFMMWNAESEIGLLYVQGFPSLQPGQTYQLWLTRGAVRASVGTFTVDDKGKSALLFHSADPIDKYTWARITSEPESGSPQPTGQVVVNGKLS